MAISIGCGSWGDQEYVGLLYPRTLPKEERLTAYASHFDHVEVNSSYYATPRPEAVANWVRLTPPAFTFDVKLHRVFSRSPEKMTREGKFLGYLDAGLRPLIAAGRLGAYLLVLAPDFSPEKHRLEELDLLVEKLAPTPLAVELRHTDWVKGKARDRTLGYFREHGVTWVAVDMPRLKDTSLMPVMDEVTNPRLAYFRLHGRNKNYLKAESAAERHTHAYNDRELKELAERIRILAGKAEQVRVVANNHAHDFAPKTALALKSLLGQPQPASSGWPIGPS
jgi:uncharacterized protein YecE (DUF72 family)